MEKSIVILLLILFLGKNVSVVAQELYPRYKIPSVQQYRNIEKLETQARLFFIESAVVGAMGGGCLAAGLVKAHKEPDFSAHFTKEQRHNYAERWNTSSKVLIGVGAGLTAASAVFAGIGIKCVQEIKLRKPKYKLKFELGTGAQPGPVARISIYNF
ncbi:MAG: hypothetical protein RMJ53_09885 [Chitinophagales bacterium]|nr:hypothetical protein [Chitinophagales bacterium]MDW8274525.1 hypothetical protein [Chitinophagales bacterium]